MKTKLLILSGFAALTLSSCGGPKSYKHIVELGEFRNSVEDTVLNSDLFKFSTMYSYELTMNIEVKETETYFKNGATHSKHISEEKGEMSYKYDSENIIINMSQEGETKEKDPSYEKSEEIDYECGYQCDSTNYYFLNMKEKTYEKHLSSSPKEAIQDIAKSYALSTINGFVMLIGSSNTTYYIDNNINTITKQEEVITTEKAESKSFVYQLVLDKNEASFYTEINVTSEKLNIKKSSKSVSETKLRRKDINLSLENLNSYLISENSDF